ncbi:S-methyl-5-thioribose-1-phosphate isomerase [candidate division KSB1 bacterium]|nr:MAG: S-methyl-5-thioribose-1-phosphate isomerase [candidate division KSB1 bacterium]
MPVKTIEFADNIVRIIDQTLLPAEFHYITISNVDDMADAIRKLKIRGAPAIGIAGAYGIVLAALSFKGNDPSDLKHIIVQAADLLKSTRPTAVNLFWAIDRMLKILSSGQNNSAQKITDALLKEAETILEEDRERCRRLGRNGAELLPSVSTVITHCNAGALATADYGTALGVVYAAVEAGKKIMVFSDETRPLLQGSRITAAELVKEGIPVTVICDSAAGFVMANNKIDAVIVGADRIAANGDTANKIGTYGLAVLAEKHKIPFYVAAPLSTFDFSLKSGSDIPIEERSKNEICFGFGTQTCPDGADVYNPAFDVTPAEFVTAFITEYGVFRQPYKETLEELRIIGDNYW